MERFEYIKIPFRWIPKEIFTQYNIYSLVEPDVYVYCEVGWLVNSPSSWSRLGYHGV